MLPYKVPGFHDRAIAEGRHRAIVGGHWEETGNAQMQLLLDAGLQPHHHLLDAGAGSLRLGRKAVAYLDPGHYWGTDASRALMLAGLASEMPDDLPVERHPDPAQLIQDDTFEFPGVSDAITHVLCFAVLPHLPPEFLEKALQGVERFPALEMFLFTVFLAPEIEGKGPFRQTGGVVTHPAKAPFHVTEEYVRTCCAARGWSVEKDDRRLPRGQVLFTARREGRRES